MADPLIDMLLITVFAIIITFCTVGIPAVFAYVMRNEIARWPTHKLMALHIYGSRGADAEGNLIPTLEPIRKTVCWEVKNKDGITYTHVPKRFPPLSGFDLDRSYEAAAIKQEPFYPKPTIRMIEKIPGLELGSNFILMRSPVDPVRITDEQFNSRISGLQEQSRSDVAKQKERMKKDDLMKWATIGLAALALIVFILACLFGYNYATGVMQTSAGVFTQTVSVAQAEQLNATAQLVAACGGHFVYPSAAPPKNTTTTTNQIPFMNG